MFLVLVLATFVVSLVVAVVLDRRRRHRRAPYRILVGALCFGTTLSLLWLALVGTFLVALFEPWPLSLRHGPDTPYAREVFTQHMQFVPPASVTALYGHRQWAGFGEHITSITFRFTDEEVIRTMVTTLSLEVVPADEVQTLRALAGPGWWPAQDVLSRLPEVYRHKWGADAQVFRHVWIDRVQRLVYFQDVDIG